MSLVSIKAALRIGSTTDAYDDEIGDLIAACKLDLAQAGVQASKLASPDALLKRAITAYCKAHFGWNSPDAERLAASYAMLKSHLSLSGDYRGYQVTFSVTSGGSPVAGARVECDGRTLPTSAAGIAVFNGVLPENQMEYAVAADDYDAVEGVLDVTEDLTVAVALVTG